MSEPLNMKGRAGLGLMLASFGLGILTAAAAIILAAYYGTSGQAAITFYGLLAVGLACVLAGCALAYKKEVKHVATN